MWTKQKQGVTRCKNLLQNEDMKIGYARVSREEQNLDLQLNALRDAGCKKIFHDEGVSGGIAPENRVGFAKAQKKMNSGDTLVVWKMDRLGRSLGQIINTLDTLNEDGVQFVSLTEPIDTTTAMGRAFWQITGVFSEMERALIQERTKEGLKAAVRRGQRLGRPPALTAAQVLDAAERVKNGEKSVADMARLYGVQRSTVHRALKRLKLKNG